MKKFFGHLKTVLVHKWWVFYYCNMVGLTWRGIKHDLSKFNPVEFFESVKYYTGTGSPINACKKDKGWSKAWQHHKGHNTHHYEYWQDNFDNGGTALLMPFEDNLEMLCDYLAAGRAYMKKDFTFSAEYKWWRNKIRNPVAMHKVNKHFIEISLCMLLDAKTDNILRTINFKKIYNDIWREELRRI